MSNKPLLSVIMPVYNAEKWVAESIQSILNQDYNNLELICIDDGSSDNSVEIIKRFQINDNRVKLFEQKNSGVCSARNLGIENAKGDYIAFIDADDIALKNMYSCLINLLEKEQSDISFCAFTRFFPSGKQLTTTEYSFDRLKNNPQDIKYFLYTTPSVINENIIKTKDIHGSCCRSIFKKNIIVQNSIRFTKGITFAEDQVFMLEYLLYCNKISYTDKSFLMYRANTKRWVYRDYYDSHMRLLDRQLFLLDKNKYYSKGEKRKISAYLKYSIYMMITNDELMFKENADDIIKNYDVKLKKMLTLRGLIEKLKVNKDYKKLVLFILLKLKQYKLVVKLFPNKKY